MVSPLPLALGVKSRIGEEPVQGACKSAKIPFHQQVPEIDQ